jgi:hypothetical protein
LHTNTILEGATGNSEKYFDVEQYQEEEEEVSY